MSFYSSIAMHNECTYKCGLRVTYLADNLTFWTSQGGDHSGAMKAYQLMLELGFSEGKSSSTFNKLIHSASMTDGLESAFKVTSLLHLIRGMTGVYWMLIM
jgi:hypothetical protein